MMARRFLTVIFIVLFNASLAANAATKKSKVKPPPSVSKPISRPSVAKPQAKRLRKKPSVGLRRARRGGGGSPVAGASVAGGPWLAPTFADSTYGDMVDGDDLVVRRTAVEALGPYNGTVVVADPQTGRILTIVNQKLAFQSGFQPCSTIKIVAALAGLSEGVIDSSSEMQLSRRSRLNLTSALAHSNNPYFANVGMKLGFEKIDYYARLFGLGEKAGLNIEGEEPGTLPQTPPANGGVGMMMSFGEGITLTPLQLTSLVSAVANGGTLYYLQYPKSQAEAENFVPRVKRHLAIQQTIPDVKPGMLAAVEYGTARRASYDPNEPIFGKTGTCTDRRTPTHLGWFGSFNDVNNKKLSVVVLLTGGRPVNGPVASGIAGAIYRSLSQRNYFVQSRPISPVALVSASSW